ncbi:hypothetical protein HMPREF0556_12242 [Listeria grayi DSM 20601]|uniref:Uncharacterized protein n=1 Tax=Listeria grayi DSM 20601 TaxID=525367 RepID=D7UYZ0_LISGR|nr:hypothetical protein HMPREF0556_12242 [Listeria grayi DSM 20601]
MSVSLEYAIIKWLFMYTLWINIKADLLGLRDDFKADIHNENRR